MRFLYKIVALFLLTAITYSIEADAGEDAVVYTEHNGSPDANATIFNLNGSGSGPYNNISFYFWKGFNVDTGEEIVVLNNNNVQASFESAVEYGNVDKVFEFELTIYDNTGDLIIDLNNNGIYDTDWFEDFKINKSNSTSQGL